MDPDIKIDALPYIDEFSPQMEAEVYRLLEEQMKTFTPPNYLEHHAPVSMTFSSPFLQQEWERICSEGKNDQQPSPMPPLDQTRYSLPIPPAQLLKKPQAWQSALDNATAQLQHQLVRAENLELLIHYGPNAWRLYNERIEDQRQRLAKILQEIRKEIETVNLARKNRQIPLAPTFQHLTEEYVHTIRKNAAIEKACSQLENEIRQLTESGQV